MMDQDAERKFLMSAYALKGFGTGQYDSNKNVGITPYRGAHEKLVGVVITINGGSTKGTFLHEFGNDEIIFYFGANLKRITPTGRNKKYYDATIYFLKRKGVLTEEGRVNQGWKDNA